METICKRKVAMGIGILALAFIVSFSLIGRFSKAYALDLATAEAQLSSASAVLDSTSDTYYQKVAEDEDLQQQINDCRATIDDDNAKIAAGQDHLAKIVKNSYRNGNSTLTMVMAILDNDAGTFEDLLNTTDSVNKIQEDKVATVNTVKTARQEAEAKQAELEQAEQQSAAAVAAAAEAKATAEAAQAQAQATYNALSAEQQAQLAAARAGGSAAAAAGATAGTTAGTAAGTAATDSGDSGSSASSGGGGGTSSGSYEGGSDAVSRAYACLGAPYVWGAAGPGGYDCSGLVSYCLTGVHEHSYSSGSFAGSPVASSPSPGDVCYRPGHVGIYVGGGMMIHAADYGIGVIESSVPGDMVIVVP